MGEIVMHQNDNHAGNVVLMSALIFGYYAAKVQFPWHVRWAMVVGAFTNSSLFLLMAIFPIFRYAQSTATTNFPNISFCQFSHYKLRVWQRCCTHISFNL